MGPVAARVFVCHFLRGTPPSPNAFVLADSRKTNKREQARTLWNGCAFHTRGFGAAEKQIGRPLLSGARRRRIVLGEMGSR
jgi:hypothetical protein